MVEFKHKVISSAGSYRIESPDADAAAMKEMGTLLQEIGSALGDFFRKGMGIKESFSVIFDGDGMLSLEKGALTGVQSQAVRDVLESLNKYLKAEESGEETEGMLSGKLQGIGEKFVELKEVMDKIHDKSLLPKDGWKFTF